jgi:hypothetical protein
MRGLVFVTCLLLAGCGSSNHGTNSSGGSGGATASGGNAGTMGSGGSSGANASGGSGGTTDSGGSGATSSGGAGGAPPAPGATCTLPAPLVDVSQPTTVVGDGSAASCTAQAFAAAVAKGGIVTFDCGSSPVTVTVSSEVPVSKDTTIDGGGLVTLSGGKKSRILHIMSAWNVATPLLTVQNLTFVDGFTSDVQNTTSTREGGGAIFEDGGSLTVIDCTFTGNRCASSGEDVSGGAINGQGVGTLIVEGSTFANNSGSNGGGVGTQDENVTVVNSTFSNNSATGTDGNPGNGGDGGGLTYDGSKISLTLCGDKFVNNHANAAGGAVFRVAYTDEATNIDRCTFDGNSVDANAGNAGGLYLEYTTINMSATTISNNSAHYGGGIWIGHAAVANVTNVTIADNTAVMGGGVWFANQVTGTFENVTVAGNQGDGLFGGDTGLTLANTIVAGNLHGSMDGSDNCTDEHGAAGVDMQSSGAGHECTASVTTGDPQLGALADNGGPTETMLPAATSPAVGKGAGCPSTDQRGDVRPSSGCTLGAVEVK